MTPTENFMFVNDFVGRMGPAIQEHSGFVNQYLGDGIMAIFPEKAEDAINASTQMMRELDAFNEDRASKGKERIRVGIGLHTGPLIMGIIGDENRSDPATIADAVNTSSRLEGLTKHFKANVIISENSLDAFPEKDPTHFRYHGKVKLKGKNQIVGIYESVMGDAEELRLFKIRTSSLFNEGVRLYQNGSFREAIDIFEELNAQEPLDNVAAHFHEKLQRLIEGTIPPDWEAIEVMSHK